MLYNTRYQACKVATGRDVVVKVCGGYTIMDVAEWQQWRKQK